MTPNNVIPGSIKFKYVLFSALFLISCKSEFNEKKGQGKKLPQTVAQQNSEIAKDVADRLSGVEGVYEGIRFYLEKLNSLKSTGLNSLALTDVMEKITRSLKNSAVVKNGNEYISVGQIYSTHPGVSDTCRTIDTRSRYTKSETNSEHVVEISTCKTNFEFKPIYTTEIKKSKVHIQVNNDLFKYLPGIDETKVVALNNCEGERKENVLISLSCAPFKLKLNKLENLLFEGMSYVKDRDPNFMSILKVINEESGASKTFRFNVTEQNRVDFTLIENSIELLKTDDSQTENLKQEDDLIIDVK